MKRLALALAFVLVAGSAWAATVTLNVTAGTNAVSHTIEKSTNAGPYSTLTTLTMPTVQHVDSAVVVGNNYSYRSITNSSVDSAAPSAPCTVTLLAAGSSSVSCTINP